jgi:CBS-domain-containing membrane protein
MKAADVMTRNVITVGPEASVREVAGILLLHHISAVPVVAHSGELLGIVSEGDLMRRAEAETKARRQWWLELLASNVTTAADFVRLHSNKVTDVMTRKVVTAAPDTSVAEVAALLERHGIKRVPIVEDGKVAGIVSRANLVQAWASVRPSVPAATALSDSAIRDSVMARLKTQSWTGPWPLNAIVHDGTVELWGLVGSEDEKKGIRLVAEQTEGVRAVNDHLRVRVTVITE